jgi:hypothetical protein
VPDPLAGGAGEVGLGEVGEVLRLLEHLGELVVQVQEGLQVAEGVGPPQGVDVGVTQLHAVALRQLEGELRLERPLDVHVQLGGGQRRESG